MINGQQPFRKTVFEGNFEQENERTAINAGAVRIGHSDQIANPIMCQRIGQFPQRTIEDHTHYLGLVIFLEEFDKFFQSRPTPSGNNPSVNESQFNIGSWVGGQVKVFCHSSLFLYYSTEIRGTMAKSSGPFPSTGEAEEG